MKKIIAILMLVMVGFPSFADTKISDLPALGTPDAADLLLSVDVSTSTNKKLTITSLFTSPTLVTPNIGTPSAGVLTNATGLPISTGVSGLGTGVATALTVNTGSAGAVVLFNGALGTPSSGTLTNATGLPVSTGISGLGSGMATFLATPSSANLASTLTGETGSGAAVFGTSPTIATPTISGAITFSDGDKQVFNPNGTNAGLNVGAHTADPSSPVDGDIFYDSDDDLLRAYINGSWVSLGAGGGGIGGTLGSTDNLIPRADGTGGATLQGSGITLGDVGSNNVTLTPITNTALTLATLDNNRNIVLAPHGTGVVEQRNGTNAQQLNIYSTYTDGSNYARLEVGDITDTFPWSGLGLFANAAGTGGNVQLVLGAHASFGRVVIAPGGAAAWFWEYNGNLLTVTDNSYDIGASGANRPRDVFIADDLVIGDALTIGGTVTFPDGVRQTFNPNGTNSGLNVGAHTADPSSPANGDLFYDSDDNLLRAYIDGAWVSLGAGGGGGSIGGSTGSTDNVLLRSNGTGGATLQGSDIIVSDVSGGYVQFSSPSNGLIFVAEDGQAFNFKPSASGHQIIQLNNIDTFTRSQSTGALTIATNAAGIIFAPSGTTAWTMNGSGHLLAGTDNTYDIGASGATRPRNLYLGGGLYVGGAELTSGGQLYNPSVIRWPSGARISKGTGAAGVLFEDDTQSGASLLQIGGTSSSFPALKRSSAALHIRLSDDSDYADLRAAGITGTTLTLSAAMTLPDGVRQVFNPNGTNSGFNVGAHTADPSSPTDGDIFYDSDDELLRARINGSWVSLAGGGGSGDVTAASSFGTDNVLIRSDGTGKGVQSTGITVNDSNELSGVAEINATTGNVDVLMVNGTDIEDLLDAKAPTSRTLTIAGTANEITSSAGAQDLSANRTWTLSLPSALTFTGKTVTGGTYSGITLDGAATLAENARIALDPAGSADGKYSGTTIAGTAGATLAFGDLIVLDPTDSRWELADANSAAAADGDSRGMVGICVLAAAADGDPTIILLHGVVRADTAFPSLTVNGGVFISETAGDITNTSPATEDAVIRYLGAAITADEIYFNPSGTWITYDEP